MKNIVFKAEIELVFTSLSGYSENSPLYDYIEGLLTPLCKSLGVDLQLDEGVIPSDDDKGFEPRFLKAHLSKEVLRPSSPYAFYRIFDGIADLLNGLEGGTSAFRVLTDE